MIVSRLAPTPSGLLHLGNLLNFAVAWALVRKSGGKLWLRIDDHDQTRVRPEFESDILEILPWLGLDWDARTPSQASRTELYRRSLQQLETYVCTCTRAQISQRTGGEYDGHCRELKHSPQLTPQRRWRSSSPQDDVVVWRRDDLPGYHLVSVIDDEGIGSNLIVRGSDLLESTRLQLALAQALGLKNFPQAKFIHHSLLLEQGQKMAKSRGSHALSEMRREGVSSEKVWEILAARAGWPKIEAPRDMLAWKQWPWD